MRILFVNGQAFLPQMVGGVETSTLDLALTLKESGHHVAVMCELKAHNALWFWNRLKSWLLKLQFPKDRYQGLLVYRGWNLKRGLEEVVKKERPDAVVVQGALYNSYEIAAESARKGPATFFYMHDLNVVLKQIELPDMTGVTWIANSNFTAQKLHTLLGVDSEIIPPLMRPELYRTDPAACARSRVAAGTGKMVTMINPRPLKGGDLALQLAQLCPDIPFLFVEAWSGLDPAQQALKNRAAGLRNVTWLKSQSDMRAIYGLTRLLLVPSQCEETWGRVVTEAQFSGIPALTSRLGALPETVGPAGITVEADAEIERWLTALRSIWDSPETYEHLSRSALEFSSRRELSPDPVAEKFIRYLRNNSRRTVEQPQADKIAVSGPLSQD